MKNPKRPGAGSNVATPLTLGMIGIFGMGIATEDVAMSVPQLNAVRKLYGFKKESPNKKPEPPAAPEPPPQDATCTARWDYERKLDAHKAQLKSLQSWQDPREFLQAGADRNAMRFARSDGLRMLAWIAKYLVPGDDPVKALIGLAVDAGWDVEPEDCSWATEENEDAS